MANTTNTETDQAIKQLTDQIAQLSINLAQKTTPTTVNYADTPNQAPPTRQPPTCHYCGRTGHFIAKCNARRQDQQSQRPRQSERTSRSSYQNYSRCDYRNQSRSRSRDNYRNRSRS